MSKGRRFFISYAHKHAASFRVLGQLKSRLEREGHRVFDDTSIPLGTDWQRALVKGIRECDLFIVLVSKRSLASPHVQQEVLTANNLLETYKWPSIVPIRVQYKPKVTSKLATVLNRLEWTEWDRDADTIRLVQELDERAKQLPARSAPGEKTLTDEEIRSLVPRIPPRWRARAIATASALLAIVVTVSVALHFRAQTLLKSTSRYDVDRGLVLSALSALVRGWSPSSATQKLYDREHYRLLLRTIRIEKWLRGRDLAISNGPRVMIAADGSYWSCPNGLLECRSDLGGDLGIQESLEETAFRSEGLLVTRDFDGIALQHDLQKNTATPLSQDTTSLAVRNGEVAMGFATTPFAIVYDRRDTPQWPPPGSVGGVRRLAFGPCPACITILGGDGRVSVWDRNAASVTPITSTVAAKAIAATTAGGQCAVLWANRTVTFFDRSRTRGPTVTTRVDPEKVQSMVISEDGRDVAMLHDGDVILIGSSDPEIPLVVGELKPVTSAVAFADGHLVTRTVNDIRIWSRDRALLGEESAPIKAWKWRQQFGLPWSSLFAAPSEPARY